jgi:hypothetical protein
VATSQEAHLSGNACEIRIVRGLESESVWSVGGWLEEKFKEERDNETRTKDSLGRLEQWMVVKRAS